MDDEKKKTDESVSRRSFLTSLGKWSSIVVATAVLWIPEASGSVEGPKEARELGTAREGNPDDDDGDDESTESQGRGGRGWGRGGRGWGRRGWGWGWGNAGCRVWGNAGCRVWGNAGCRVWGNR
jgi:hypothetical protein